MELEVAVKVMVINEHSYVHRQRHCVCLLLHLEKRFGNSCYIYYAAVASNLPHLAALHQPKVKPLLLQLGTFSLLELQAPASTTDFVQLWLCYAIRSITTVQTWPIELAVVCCAVSFNLQVMQLLLLWSAQQSCHGVRK